MPRTPKELQAARDTLATLYPTAKDACRVVWDAGLKEGRFEFSGGAQSMWTEVVKELARGDDLDAVLEVAAKEYPKRGDVRALLAGAVPGAGAAPPRGDPAPAAPPAAAALERAATPSRTWKLTNATAVDFRKLTGGQWRALQSALGDAFPDYDDLRNLVKFHFGENFNNIASSKKIDTAVFDLIQWSQARGWTERLFQAARAEHPDHAELAAFGLAAVAPGAVASEAPVAGGGLERVLRQEVPLLKLADLLAKLGEVQARVCRVEVAGRVAGTGFLVGPSAVMTCYHVVQGVITGAVAPSEVVLRFDLRPDYQGTVVRLAADWKIDAAPYAMFELVADAPGTPTTEELDYAVLRTEGAPGTSPIGGGEVSPNAPERKWVRLPGGDLALMTDAPLYVVQHPDGRTMEIGIETKGVGAYNANRTRLAHRVNTEPGTSGSPVFGFDGTLVALHHAGTSSVLPVSNQAIPIDAIRKLMEKRGTLAALGG